LVNNSVYSCIRATPCFNSLIINYSPLYILLVSLFVSVWLSIKKIMQKFHQKNFFEIFFIDLGVTNFLDIVCKCFEKTQCFIWMTVLVIYFKRLNPTKFLMKIWHHCLNIFTLPTRCLKDARSVSWYPYNRSQILQYVKYTK